MKQHQTTVVYAAAVRDATGVNARPGGVLIQEGRVVAAGDPAALPADLLASARVINRDDDLLLPAMVNAHTHLELTGIGPRPYDPAGGFINWVLMLRTHFPHRAHQAHRREGLAPDDTWFVEATRRGIDQSYQAGVQAVGDISRFPSVADAVRASLLGGATYLELFGLGKPFNQGALDLMAEQDGRALQPHAPYSAGPALFDAAARSGRPVACHLAETLDEHAFVGKLLGPYLEFIKSVEKWDDAFSSYYGQGLTPVQWMRPYFEIAAHDGGWLVAHCNYVSDEDIAILADTNTSVAYCPIASEYFGHKDHRYRAMLDAGVNVCLGTDSIVGTDPDDPQPLGLVSAMRRLYQRDQADPADVLEMATTRGARALRLDQQVATLRPGASARFACLRIDPDSPIDPLAQALAGRDPVKPLSFAEDA